MAEKLKKYIFYAVIVAVGSPLVSSQNPIFGLLIRPETLFQVTVEIVAVLFLVLLAVDPSYRPKRSSVAIAVLVWLAVWGLATIFSQNPSRAFFSSRERLTGYFFLAHLAAFFFIVSSVFRTATERRMILQASVIVSVFASLYGLAQLWGLVHLPVRQVGQLRVFSTLGNPSFLASYLLFHIFFGGYLIATEKRKSLRRIWVGAIIVNTFLLFLTGTRGAYLGFYAGVVSLAIIASFLFQEKYRGRFRLATLALFIAPIILFALFQSGVIPRNFYFARLTDPYSLWQGGIRNRVLAWRIGWDAFGEKPLFGWGPDQFNVAFDKHFDTELISIYGAAESWFDRAHNVFVDALVMAGMAGFLAMLALLIVMMIKIFEPGQKEFSAFLTAGLIAYIVQGFFIFDSFGSYLPLFLLAALLTPLGSNSIPHRERRISPFFLAALVAGALLFLGINVASARAQALGWRAFTFINEDPASFTKLWEKSRNYKSPYERDMWVELTEYLLGEAPWVIRPKFSLPVMLNYAQVSKKQFLDLESRQKLDAMMYYQAGRLGNFLGILGEFDPEFVGNNLAKALELSPRRLDIYYEFAEMERLKGNPEGQFDWIEKAIALDEKVSFSWWNLGIAYADKKEYRKAVQSLERAIEMGYKRWKDDAEQIPYIVAIYDAGAGPIERIVEFWEAATEIDKNNAQFFASLAASYAAKGDREKARAAALRAAAIDPSFKPEAEKFLQQLGF